jgi:hypothetical protein
MCGKSEFADVKNSLNTTLRVPPLANASVGVLSALGIEKQEEEITQSEKVK